MGVLDNPGSQALGNVLGGSTNRLAAGILQMIQNQRGGLQGLVQSMARPSPIFLRCLGLGCRG